MRNLKNVYRYRYDGKNCVWEKLLLENVLISGTLNAYSLSDTQNRDAHITLRVMSEKEVDVLPEDVIVFTEEATDAPPKERAVVVSVTRNLQGGKYVRHTKILCR